MTPGTRTPEMCKVRDTGRSVQLTPSQFFVRKTRAHPNLAQLANPERTNPTDRNGPRVTTGRCLQVAAKLVICKQDPESTLIEDSAMAERRVARDFALNHEDKLCSTLHTAVAQL